MKLLVFTGGGTGGHIYPGLAIIDELKKISDCSVIWLGASAGIDKSIVNDRGIPFVGIPSGKLRRYFSFQNFFDVFKIASGFFASFYYFIKLKPAAVFSKGGFVSVPPCFAAKVLGIPVYTHECDFSPGLATKLNSRVASHIFVSYKETADAFDEDKKKKIVVTGNPVRPVFYEGDPVIGRRFLSLSDKPEKGELPVLFVLGGSLGARQINTLIIKNLEWLCSRFIVVHQTGEKNSDQTADISMLSEKLVSRYKAYPYLKEEMPHVLAASSLVLARSGANTLWECAVAGKAMVLIPLYGSGTRGDQVENAEYFMKKGAAVVLTGEDATSENLKNKLEYLLADRDRLSSMSVAAGNLGTGNAAVRIAKILADEVI